MHEQFNCISTDKAREETVARLKSSILVKTSSLKRNLLTDCVSDGLASGDVLLGNTMEYPTSLVSGVIP
jgi:hypothetical protein